ncbi:MAG TPA: hypothetical protein PLU50_09145, partial [Pseudobdellovibrionaceae bacterium]|nr:hypothetical protein [Pseudobdellovibrionaceae bacterium]
MKNVLPSIIISFGMWSGTAFSQNVPAKPNANRYYVLEKHFDGADKKQLAMDLATDLRATLGGAEVWMQGNRPYPGDYIFFVKRKMSDSPLDLEKLRSKYGKVSFQITQIGGNKMTPQQVEKSMKDFYTQLDYEFYHPLEDMATQLDSYGTPKEIQLKRAQEVRAATAIASSTILYSDFEIGFRFIDQIGQYIGA